MKNSNDDIISFIHFDEIENIIVFPQIQDKKNFLHDFLSKVAPSLFPAIFPFSTEFKWKEHEEYWLPKHKLLVDQKEAIQRDYEKQLLELDDKIQDNLLKYSFLHDMISESADDLVKALVNFMKWLEFKSVKNHDLEVPESSVLEEDIQIELEVGLLIIESKGIGGTSTDSDCSQISKIKHRRSKERNKFDVYALYIVNHQRYLPPLKRKHPPFSQHQIQDAINDERGLLTTWQLFNLYNDIEQGVITKEEAGASLLDYGLVTFRPSNLQYVYEPQEFFQDGKICIITISNLALRVNEEVFIERDGQFERATILGMKLHDKPIQSASNGEIGLKLSKAIKKKSIIWKRAAS